MAAAVAVAATADSRVSFPPLFYILHLFFSFYYLYSSLVRFSFYPSLSFVVSSLDFLPRPITLPSLCCTSAQCLEGTHRAFCFLRAAPRADPAKRGSSIRLPVNIWTYTHTSFMLTIYRCYNDTWNLNRHSIFSKLDILFFSDFLLLHFFII